MTNFQSRLLVGAGYVGLTIAATLLGERSTFIYIGLIAVLALFELYRITKTDERVDFIGIPVVIGLFLMYRLVHTVKYPDIELWARVGLVVLFIGYFIWLWKAQGDPGKRLLKLIGGWLYIPIPLAALVLIGHFNGDFDGMRILIVFILIWASDTFAYLVGRQWGKHKLAPIISPKKTIEGFVGGIAASVLIGIGLNAWLGIYSLTDYIFIALICSVIGTMGDLFESKIKRNLGIKDSGTILGGHGGILDRMDSILFAAPSVYLYLYLVQNL